MSDLLPSFAGVPPIVFVPNRPGGSNPSFTTVKVGNGSALLPSYAFVTFPNMGFWVSGAPALGISVNGQNRANFAGDGTGLTLRGTYPFGWGDANGFTPDLMLGRNAAGKLQIGTGAFAAGIGLDVTANLLNVRNVTLAADAAVLASGYFVSAAAFMVRSTIAWTNGAAAALGTLANAPAAGNPTKWIPVDDNGTTRFVPAW